MSKRIVPVKMSKLEFWLDKAGQLLRQDLEDLLMVPQGG